MNAVDTGLRLQLALAVTAVAAALLAPARLRSRLTGAAAALTAGAGMLTGLAAMRGTTGTLALPSALPLDPMVLAPDRLGGLFMVLAGGVGVLAAVYGIGYVHGPAASRTGWTAFAVFVPAVQLVPAASDVVSFLLVWEAMALTSTILLLADHAGRPAVLSAGRWYAVMTHLSFLLLLAGFAALSADSGGTAFSRAAAAPLSPLGSTALVALSLGFAAKAGLVPLHVWLPRAHPEAPSHVSAVMSASMVAMGVYGLLLVGLRLLPDAPRWWGVALAVVGAASALYGILQASVASDLKRLLGYSTTENAGLMTVALGVAVLLRGEGDAGTADVALVACLLLALSHAAFKATLFLGAGSVLRATGERDLDRLGGLAARMPWTAASFAAASLGAAALPITAGFVSEWVLLQAIIHGARGQDRLVAVVLPLVLAAVALTAGLALMTFVKAVGVGFLARPRSQAASEARESPPSMVAALVAGAASVVLLGLAAGPVVTAVAATVGASGLATTATAGVRLTDIGATIEPLLLGAGALVATAAVAAVSGAAARRRARRWTPLPWGCGGVRLSPRMQYTATSYAEPLVRVFDDALRPSRDVEVTHADESRYVVHGVQFRQRVGDVVETHLYRPAQAVLEAVADRARAAQNGSIHRYLSYSFVALVALLVAVAR